MEGEGGPFEEFKFEFAGRIDGAGSIARLAWCRPSGEQVG